MTVIQFSQLEDLMAEPLSQANAVRVVVLDVTEQVSSQIPNLRQAGVGVHIRTLNDRGQVLACYLRVASIQLYNGRREGDPTWQAYDAAWNKAEQLKEQVVTHLKELGEQRGFAVVPAGIIDIGTIRPIPATWASK